MARKPKNKKTIDILTSEHLADKLFIEGAANQMDKLQSSSRHLGEYGKAYYENGGRYFDSA